jgi:hypothetical protein
MGSMKEHLGKLLSGLVDYLRRPVSEDLIKNFGVDHSPEELFKDPPKCGYNCRRRRKLYQEKEE